MKYALTLVVVALAFGSAFAGTNPDIRVYLDADPPNLVDRLDPAASESFVVSIVADCFGEGGGFRGTGILFSRTFSGFKLAQTAAQPGLDFGDVEVDPGWTLAFTDCAMPDVNEIVVVGTVEYLYLGAPGTIQILPHGDVEPGTGREALDCNFESDFWCIAGNFGVGADAPPGEGGCDCDNPVEEATWGAIKAFYR